jgi:hypothetical protein
MRKGQDSVGGGVVIAHECVGWLVGVVIDTMGMTCE